MDVASSLGVLVGLNGPGLPFPLKLWCGGAAPDRGYQANALSSETWLRTKPGTTDVLLAVSDGPFGANQFYGPYDSSERTKTWFASVQ